MSTTKASRGNADQSDATPLIPPMPLLSISSTETIQKCANLTLQPNDIFICSYPKSGTTWMQHIVLSLLFCHREQQRRKIASKNQTESDLSHGRTSTTSGHFYNHVSEYAPFFEIDPHWEGDSLVPWIQDNHTKIGCRIFFVIIGILSARFVAGVC